MFVVCIGIFRREVYGVRGYERFIKVRDFLGLIGKDFFMEGRVGGGC